jgi:hypothetical protein
MKTSIYNLEAEPSLDVYHGLIDFALEHCSLILLVLRPEMELTEVGQEVLGSLDPYIEETVKSTLWPGTEIFGTQADVCYFRLEAGSAQVLRKATDHLFGWCQPDLPEDLCFLREDRTPWLVTIAHEHDGYFVLSEWERRQLVHALPALRVRHVLTRLRPRATRCSYFPSGYSSRRAPVGRWIEIDSIRLSPERLMALGKETSSKVRGACPSTY